MTTTAVRAKAISEEDLLTAVLDLCQVFGLRTAHFRPAWTDRGWRTPVAGDGRGWPDLVIAGRKLIVRELKSEGGRLTPDQHAWFAALGVAGVDVDLWRPRHWLDGTIRTQLEEIR